MRLFKDSDREDEVQWYKASPDAKPLPFATAMVSNHWIDEHQPPAAIGEVGKRTWVKDDWSDFPGFCYSGEKEWFSKGAPVDALGQNNRHPCCAAINLNIPVLFNVNADVQLIQFDDDVAGVQQGAGDTDDQVVLDQAGVELGTTGGEATQVVLGDKAGVELGGSGGEGQQQQAGGVAGVDLGGVGGEATQGDSNVAAGVELGGRETVTWQYQGTDAAGGKRGGTETIRHTP